MTEYEHARAVRARLRRDMELILLLVAPPPGYFAAFIYDALSDDLIFFDNWHAESLYAEARMLAARGLDRKPPTLPPEEAARLMQRAADNDAKALDRLEARLRRAMVTILAILPNGRLQTSSADSMCGVAALGPWDEPPILVARTIPRMTLEESDWRYSGAHPEVVPLIRARMQTPPAPPPSNTRH